jgi:hypothetical protein
MPTLINDDDWVPWVVVGAYALALLLAARAARGTADADQRRFWWLVAAMLLLLGLNKQLDLQTQLTAVGRSLARGEGWYGARRAVQMLFIAVGGVVAAGLGLWLVKLTARAGPAVRLSLAGVFLLGAFVMRRAVSFHHVDVLLGICWAGVKIHVVLELLGIAVTGAGAALTLWERRPGPHREPGYRR